jgi:hypothetical protein
MKNCLSFCGFFVLLTHLCWGGTGEKRTFINEVKDLVFVEGELYRVSERNFEGSKPLLNANESLRLLFHGQKGDRYFRELQPTKNTKNFPQIKWDDGKERPLRWHAYYEKDPFPNEFYVALITGKFKSESKNNQEYTLLPAPIEGGGSVTLAGTTESLERPTVHPLSLLDGSADWIHTVICWSPPQN